MDTMPNVKKYHRLTRSTMDLIEEKYAEIHMREYRGTGYLPHLPWSKEGSELTLHQCALWINVHLSYLVRIYQCMMKKGLDLEPDEDMIRYYEEISEVCNDYELDTREYVTQIGKAVQNFTGYYDTLEKFHSRAMGRMRDLFRVRGPEVGNLICNNLLELNCQLWDCTGKMHELRKAIFVSPVETLENVVLTAEDAAFPCKKDFTIAYYSLGRAQGIKMDYHEYRRVLFR